MTKSVYKAICAVQAELARIGVGKDRRNEQQGYRFRGIDDVYNVIAPLLAQHGLCIIPRIVGRVCTERQTAKGGTMFGVTVEAEFDFVAVDDGSTHTVRTYGEAMDSGDKATNKAMSAAHKYAILQTFTVPTEATEDADAYAPELGEPPELLAKAREVAMTGWKPFAAWIKDQTPDGRASLAPYSDELKAAAKAADAKGTQ